MIMNKHFKIIILFFTLVAATACDRPQKFTRELWSYGDGLNYPSRKRILEDLMDNHKIKGLKHYDLVQLLGSPQFRDTTKFIYTYQIEDTGTEYNPKKNPIYRKNLLVYFSKDSVVTKTEIFEKTTEVK